MLRPLLAVTAALLPAFSPVAAQEQGPLRFMGFADFNYAVSDESGAREGFSEGALAAHLAARLAERAHFFAELTAFPRPSAFSIEVQRILLRYDFADEFQLSAGRFHTAVSHWNTAYHHGSWLQLTASRPALLSFGSDFLPQHYVGVMATGRLAAATAGLEYSIGAGNGRDEDLRRAGDAGDANDHRATLFALSAAPPALRGLQFGASLYQDRAASPAAVPAELQSDAVDERILSSFVYYGDDRPSFHAEYYRVHHDPREGERAPSVSSGYFVQAGYRLPGSFSPLTPYARYERLDVAEDDPLYGAALADRTAGVVGLRYDFLALASLKGEYRMGEVAGADPVRELVLQLSFVFGAGEQRAEEPVSAGEASSSHHAPAGH